MKVLILGSGAREHAIADAFARSTKTSRIYLSPGNDGIAPRFECVCLPCFQQIIEFCRSNSIDVVFIGPEQPIAEGLSDLLREASIPVVGRSKAAARLETSKAFAKEIMNLYSIPTAEYRMIYNREEAEQVLSGFQMPVVLKADGLAAGKGVIIANDMGEALAAGYDLLDRQCGSSGVLAEEFLQGWEVSLFAFSDGVSFKTTLFAQDHKQLLEQDRGPNTGGMGAFCPVAQAEPYRKQIEQEILEPIFAAMRTEGCPYSGILYLGLMITNSGPKVIEYNCRLGDPETQAVLPLLNTDIMDICLAICNEKMDQIDLQWDTSTAVAVVLAAPGYPGKPQQGIPIKFPRKSPKVYCAGIKRGESGWLSTSGRVMSVVALADNLEQARAAVYRDIAQIEFPNMVYRKDIGQRTNKL